ncbi:hypothetical protein GGR51DRAFT_545685 [Nemania sp. FL0031]|nr:hypothetical protein GGR51DRAFT_545685 [Nemania sp. FL0031]
MAWFDEQIKQDVITQDECLLRAFVKFLHMQSHAEIQPFSLVEVDGVFNEWLEKNPAYRRRYLITQQDLHRLFAEEPQYLGPFGSAPWSEPQNRHGGCHSLALSCERGDGDVKAEKESTNPIKDTDHETHLSATRHSRSSPHPRSARIDEQFSYFTDTDVVLSQQSNDAYAQEADGDDVIIIQESIQPPPGAKMSRKSTRRSRGRRRSRQHMAHNDVSESTVPPKKYICRRCHKPGHLIQHCPTNLDPSYDQPPPGDYRCNFCGRHGDHFATLCPENPYEGSLSKQREHTKVETGEPRAPTGGDKHRYQDEEYSAIRSRDRYRSRSPKQRSEVSYRSRSPNRGDTYNARTRNRDNRRQPQRIDDLDVSPYTMRARLTRELYVSSDTSQEEESSPRSWDDSFSFEPRLSRSPPPRRCPSPFAKKSRQRPRDLDKVTNKADEGRLAYDDDIEAPVKPKTSPCSPTDYCSQNTTIDREEMPQQTESPAVIDVEDLNKVKDKTDEFLLALAAEVMLKCDTSRSKRVNNCDAETGVDSSLAMEVCIGDEISSNTTVEIEELAAQPTPKNRPVHCPPFSPATVSLFNTRENPIINPRAKRQTASQMMEKSEGFWEPIIQQASQATTTHPPLPHSLLNTGGEDCVSVN